MKINMKKILLILVAVFGFGISTNAQTVQNNTFDQGVVINGIKWATRNVAAPGTFAANPEDAGMYYQWNRKIGWNAALLNSNGSSIWDVSYSTGNTWEKANDPSPTGWRVPTQAEFETLLDVSNVRQEYVTVNSINGIKFTDITTGNSIFLRATGRIDGADAEDGVITDNKIGFYWSSEVWNRVVSVCFSFSNYYEIHIHKMLRSVGNIYYSINSGLSVRSVAESTQYGRDNSSSSSNYENTQDSSLSKTIHVAVAVKPSGPQAPEWHPDNLPMFHDLGSALFLNSKGRFAYYSRAFYRYYNGLEIWTAPPSGNYHLKGKYFIDSNNVIHFTYDNGNEDSGSILGYDENGKIVISYRGNTLGEVLDEELENSIEE